MSTDLTLLRGEGGPSLTPRNLQIAAVELSRGGPLQIRVHEKSSTLRVRIRMQDDDSECASVTVRFAKNGRSLSGSARGRNAPLLYWCFHRLAEAVGGRVRDPQAEPKGAPPSLAALERDAVKLVQDHEEQVDLANAFDIDDHEEDDDLDEELEDAAFVEVLAHLVKAGTLVLAVGDGVTLGEQCEKLARLEPLSTDPGALYEALLEADEVDDIFVSETEFAGIIERLSTES